MITTDQIRERLSHELKSSRLSQTKIAEELGISQQMVSCYLLGKKLPTLETFANLCKILDADPAYILCLNK